MSKGYVVYHDCSVSQWWNFTVGTASTAAQATQDFLDAHPSRIVFWVEESSDEWRNMHPVRNPAFTEWAKARMVTAQLNESVYTVSASAEDKPVRKFKQPELPLEVYHTVEFDPVKAWAATKAASEGQ